MCSSDLPLRINCAKNLALAFSAEKQQGEMLGGVYPEPIRFALSKITRGLSFPRKRESSSMWTYLDARLREGDNTGDFHLFGWAVGPCTLRVNCANGLSTTAVAFSMTCR